MPHSGAPFATAALCRLCLSARGDTRSIFQADRPPAALADRIRACVSVQVDEDDGMPSQICKKCLSNVNNWYAFKKVCEDSQLKLQDWLNGDGSADQEIKIKKEPSSEDDDIVIDATYTGMDLEDGNRLRLQPEGPPILASLGLAPRNEKENDEEHNMSNGLVGAGHLSTEMEHRPVPVEHLASKDCLVCGRAYRYSHNARRHELTSHGYDRYTNKIEQNLPISNMRSNSHNPKSRFVQHTMGNRVEMLQTQSSLDGQPEILKSLLTARSDGAISESEHVRSRSETPESMASDAELQPYQVETIISEPDTYMHNSDMSDDENNMQIEHSPRSNAEDIDYDIDLDLSSQLDINKIIGVDGDGYGDDYDDGENDEGENDEGENDDGENDEDVNDEYDDEGQNVSDIVESEVVCSVDAELHNIHPDENDVKEEQDDDVPESLVPIVELNETADGTNMESDDSESDDESPESNQSAILESVCDNNLTITSGQKNFILNYRDVIEQINTMKCKCCDKDFPRRKAVIQHLQKNGSKIPKHTCYSCVLQFNNIGAFLSHMRYNCCNDTWRLIYREGDIPDSMVVDDMSLMDSQDSSEGLFKSQYKEILNFRSYACKLCPAKYQLKQLIIKHVLDVHESITKVPSLTCFNCRYKFSDSRLWKKHIRNGECTVNVSCDLCSERFQSTQDFNEHVLIVHMEAFVNQSVDNNLHSTNGRSTICPLCKNSFSNYHNLIKHLRMVHNEDKPHICQHCNTKFSEVGELNQHVYLEHSEQFMNGHEEDSDVKEEIAYNYSCTECDAVFETVDGWTEHQISVHHHVAFECDQCNKKFWEESELEEHRNTHMRAQIYKCTMCSNSYATTQKLTEHIFQCHQEAHQEKHFETQFYCEICKRFFKSRQAFSNHMRIHAKVPTTNRRAGEVKRVDTQFKGHQTQPPSTQSSSKPLKIVSPAPYSCDICGKGFLHKKNIWKHKKILHSNIVNKPKETSETSSNQIRGVSTEEDEYTNDGHSHLATPQFDSFVSTMYDQPDNSGSEGNLMYQCDLCDKRFAVKSSIWKHKRVKHGVINPSTPETTRMDCLKPDSGQTDMIKSETAIISCTICKINFTDKKAYYRHRKIAHKVSLQMCKLCGMTLNTSMELFEHLRVAHEKELLGYNASQVKPQKKGLISRTNISSDEDEGSQSLSHSNNRKGSKYVCIACSKTFPDVSLLQNHNCIPQASMSETYDCEICNKSYTSISALKSHRGWHLRSPDGRAAFSNSGLWMPQNKVTSKVSKHEVLEPPRPKNQVIQKEISPLQIKRKLPPDVQVTLLKKKKFSESSMEALPMTPTIPQNPVTQQLAVNEDRYCEPCGKVFTKKAAYQRHVEEVHKLNAVFCPVCNKSFSRKSTLWVHMRKHDPDDVSEPAEAEDSDDEQESSFQVIRPPPVYRCEVCNLQYSSSKALRRHRLKHHRDVNEVGNHVNDRIAPRLSEAVEENRFIEEGVEKEYKCGVCEDEWDTEEGVWHHEHFRCSLCGMNFSQNQYLVEHMRAHNPGKEQMYFPCGQCERFYMNKKSLQRHIETFHQ
ncbi:uncharacterized protein LOC143923046 [Arctopsyche grandis]|uniref:uncharacterized protein LOC143923046 n=1 Tax=Arctopsyche grandis TaxID=121162 RepID=UPI00406D8A73